MSLKSGYILAAGHGTRMGSLASHLPKPLWPVFEGCLLDLSILTLKNLSITEIYVNTHHQSELIRNYVNEKYPGELRILEEKVLLGSGGAFHNLKKVYNVENVLSLNSDSLFCLNENFLKEMEVYQKEEGINHVLLGQSVAAGGSYNALKDDNGLFIAVDTPPKEKSYWTFSGVSLVKLSTLTDVAGKSSYFDTVIRSSKRDTYVFKKPSCIYDFGTLKNYELSCQKVFRDKTLREHLIGLGVLDPNKLNLSNLSYNSPSKGVLNFTKKKLNQTLPGLYFQFNSQTIRIIDSKTEFI